MATTSHTNAVRPRWRPRWMAVCASVALLLAGGMQPAVAAPEPTASAAPEPAVSAALPPGYEIVQSTHDNITLNPGETFSTFNTCSGGNFILSGGASLSAEPSGGGAPSLVTSGPSNPPSTSWLVIYGNPGAAAVTFGVRVTAVCASIQSSLHYQIASSAQADLLPNTQTKLEVPCPENSNIIGGGVTTGRAGGGLALLANSSHGAGWAGLFVNAGNTTVFGFNYRVTAICVDSNVPGFNTIRPQLATVDVAPGTNTIIPPLQCSASPVSGGILIWSVTPNDVAPKLTIAEDGPIPPSGVGQTSWRFRLVNYGTNSLRVQYLVSLTCVS